MGAGRIPNTDWTSLALVLFIILTVTPPLVHIPSNCIALCPTILLLTARECTWV